MEALGNIISTESVETSHIYCFCGVKYPSISLEYLAKYSEWVQKGKLILITAHDAESSSAKTLCFWAGKLAAISKPSEAQFSIFSLRDSFFDLVVELRKDGFAVSSTIVDCLPTEFRQQKEEPRKVRRSEQTNEEEEELMRVLWKLQNSSTKPPTLIHEFLDFIAREMQLETPVTAKTWAKVLQNKGLIAINKGRVEILPFVYVDDKPFSNSSAPAPEQRRFRPSQLPTFASKIRYKNTSK